MFFWTGPGFLQNGKFPTFYRMNEREVSSPKRVDIASFGCPARLEGTPRRISWTSVLRPWVERCWVAGEGCLAMRLE